MNGSLTGVLLWLVTGLVGLVSTLIGFIVHLHIKSDEEHRKLTSREFDIQKSMTDQEIQRLRDAVHDLRNSVSEIKGVLTERK